MIRSGLRSLWREGNTGQVLVKAEGPMSSAVEFVEGGAQDPCDDACSICLESFCDDDPATVRNQLILSRSCVYAFDLVESCQAMALIGSQFVFF